MDTPLSGCREKDKNACCEILRAPYGDGSEHTRCRGPGVFGTMMKLSRFQIYPCKSDLFRISASANWASNKVGDHEGTLKACDS